jgi:hypothetical protein
MLKQEEMNVFKITNTSFKCSKNILAVHQLKLLIYLISATYRTFETELLPAALGFKMGMLK